MAESRWSRSPTASLAETSPPFGLGDAHVQHADLLDQLVDVVGRVADAVVDVAAAAGRRGRPAG